MAYINQHVDRVTDICGASVNPIHLTELTSDVASTVTPCAELTCNIVSRLTPC